MLFLYCALLYFALSIGTSAAAPTSDPSQSSHGQSNLNPKAAEFRPAAPKAVDGTNLPHNTYMSQYMKANILEMKKANELGLEPGQLYNVRKYVLGLEGGSDHNNVPVAYIGPVPDYDGKIVFVSLVWQRGEVKGFPAKYTEKALPCFEPSKSINGLILPQSLMITKYTYMVWASNLSKPTRYADIKLKNTALTRIHNYMVNDYEKKNLKSELVGKLNRKDLGQTPLSKVV
ncbi:hypothetical protein F5887DRAFT_918892 [Amanita rubescens]|nr:hypothetical protein F5887DRAFT_918892 [Amanita rubescens]